jgi:hypothetical protein
MEIQTELETRSDPDRTILRNRVHCGPAEAVRLLPHTIAVSSGAALVITILQRGLQPPSPSGELVLSWAGLTLIGALAFLTRNRARPNIELRASSRRGFTAYLLSLELGILLMGIPVYLAVWRTKYEDLTGWTYPIVNKRWLVALYGLAIATLLILPAAVDRWLEPSTRTHRSSGRKPKPRPSGAAKFLQNASGIIAAVIAALYFAGPPWHVDRHHRAIDTHEQAHLGQLQAIDKGYLPYVGPASTQYGPGSQVLTYGLMKASGHFDIVAFRQAQLAIHFGTFVIVAIVAYYALGFWAMWLALLMAITLSPLSFFWTAADGTMNGMYGWGNALRYLGPLIVVPSLASLLVRRPIRENGRPIWSVASLGVIWGLFAWTSQENLTTTLVAASCLLITLWLTETITGKSAFVVTVNLLAGFVAFWSAVLMYYAFHGAAFQFVRNYTLVSGAVAMGFSNTWWPSGDSVSLLPAYYLTAPLTIAIGVATLSNLRTWSIRRGLDDGQVRLLSFVFVLLACYQSALYRSDASHLVNTLLALPFVAVLAVRDLPDWCADAWLPRAILRSFLVVVAFAVYPLGETFYNTYSSKLLPPLARFSALPQPSAVVKDGRVPFRRATLYLSDEPQAGPGMPAMRTFLDAASEIRALIGTRRTYVDSVTASGYTGLWYFLLDLTPGPILFERETMVINDSLAKEATDHFRSHVREFEAVIAPDLGSREVQAFLEANPTAERIKRSIDGSPVYILLSRSHADESH